MKDTGHFPVRSCCRRVVLLQTGLEGKRYLRVRSRRATGPLFPKVTRTFFIHDKSVLAMASKFLPSFSTWCQWICGRVLLYSGRVTTDRVIFSRRGRRRIRWCDVCHGSGWRRAPAYPLTDSTLNPATTWFTGVVVERRIKLLLGQGRDPTGTRRPSRGVASE